MKKFTINSKTGYLIGVVLFIGIWFLLSLVIDERRMIFPDPISTIKQTITILSSSYVYKCMWKSISKLLIGFFISFLLALFFGVIGGNSSTLKKVFYPTISALKSIPTASLVFLFLVLVGAKNAPILMVILISFPILYEAIVGGIENMDQDVINAMKLDSGNKLRNVIYVQIPLMVPYLLVGLASSFSLSFKIEIMAEILTGDTRGGLGSAILAAQKNDPTNMIPIFSYSLIAILLALLITIIFKILKKKLIKKI